MSLEDALTFNSTKRAKINPNQGFVKQFKEYEKEILN